MQAHGGTEEKINRRRTLSEFRTQSPIRQRNKTFYQYEPVKSPEDMYADLAVESVKKNYLVGNLKPFAVDRAIFSSLKSQVSGLREVKTPKNSNFYDRQSTIQNKLCKLLTTALSFKQSKKQSRKRKTNIKSEVFIQSQIEDDHENLIQDYQEEIVQERAHREKTIQSINKHIVKELGSFVEKGCQTRNKIVKFKKSCKVVKTYSGKEEVYRPVAGNYKGILQLEKEDYGIYSRSANKTLYYSNKEKPDMSPQPQSAKENKIERTFYKHYLGSYSQRKNILRHSEVSLKG